MIFVTRKNAGTGIKERSFFKSMKKKFVLPLAALGLMVALAGCQDGGTNTSAASGSGTPTSGSVAASSSKMEQIKISSPENAKTMVIGTTLQLTADKDGVTGFKDGTFTIEVTRPAPTAKIDWKDADHYSVDGSYTRNNRGPGDTPVYSKSQADGGECIGYQGIGDKETLTFTSTAAVAAELTSSMGSNNSVNLADVWKIKLNGTELNLAGKRYESDDSSGNYTFQEVSFGDANLIQGDNVLEIEYLVDDSPYLDNFYVYAKAATTITSKPAAPKQKIALPEGADKLTVAIGATANINCTETGVKYTSSNTDVATVDENTGAVTGVAKGTATITISKDGMLPNRVTVTVTNPSEVIIEAESESTLVEYTDGATVPSYKTSSSGGAYVRILPTGTTLTYTFTAANAGNYNLTMTGRNFSRDHEITDLSQDAEIKINNVAVDLSGKAWAYATSNQSLDLGTVTLAASNTLTFKVIGAEVVDSNFMLDSFIFTPAAA